MLLMFLILASIISADEVVDSLKIEIDSLPFSYQKGDKIWDLALYHENVLNQHQEAIDNFNIATEIFIKLDSLASAIRTNGSIIIIAHSNPEYFEFSKQAFARHISFLNNDKLELPKESIYLDILRHLKTAYFIKEMEGLRQGIGIMNNHIEDKKYDYIKIDLDYLSILVNSYFNGEQKALEQCIKVYDAVERGEYSLPFGKRESMRVKILSLMQNYHFYRGNIAESNQLLDRAMSIAKDTYLNHCDSLSAIDNINFRTDIAQIMTLKTDNIEITEENLQAIEEGYLDVNKFAKSFDKERVINNFVKIAHAYDIVYSGIHPKIDYYFKQAEKGLEFVQNPLYLTNYQLAKARYLLNKKKYEKANSMFLEVERFIDKSNQSWLKFNYVMERSRYFFEQDNPKAGYDLITNFYTAIDKNFSASIAKKTAELNNLLETQTLKNQQSVLKSDLEIQSLKNSRKNLITTFIAIVLAFITLLLINNLRLNRKLKNTLVNQNEKLKNEIKLNKKRAEELIVSEKLSTTGQIASSIAHEIKNPLTNIITASKLLKHSQTSADIEKYFQICERNSWIAIEKVNSLLEYAKQKKMIFQNYSLKLVMKNAASLTKGSLDKNGVSLNLIYKTHDDITRIDRKEFTGVLVNLILNSIQAMDESRSDNHIDVILSREDDNFIIEVKDNGKGIPAEILPKVFFPFFTTKELGTGLGLNYAQKVIIEHAGTLEIKSEVNRGTQVFIKLPLA